MASFQNLQKGKMGMGGRIAYLLAAWLLFSLGVAFLFFFWAIIPGILGLICWFGAAVLVIFAVHGMSYEEWNARRREK